MHLEKISKFTDKLDRIAQIQPDNYEHSTNTVSIDPSLTLEDRTALQTQIVELKHKISGYKTTVYQYQVKLEDADIFTHKLTKKQKQRVKILLKGNS